LRITEEAQPTIKDKQRRVTAVSGISDLEKIGPSLGGESLGAGITGTGNEDNLRSGIRCPDGVDSGLDRFCPESGPLRQIMRFIPRRQEGNEAWPALRNKYIKIT
jgi:hypothetical protein